jgi:hypothetical protein
LANLNDRQLQGLLQSNASFYDLFDIDKPHSAFKKQFIPLANSQEKVSFALMLKSCKMSFELAKSLGFTDVTEMWQQHWFSVAFDLIWLGIAYYEILASKNLPFDNKNLNASTFVRYMQTITIAIAVVQSLLTYTFTGKSTNVDTMILMLCALPLVLRSIFSAYGHLQEGVYHQPSPALFTKQTVFAGSADALEVKDGALADSLVSTESLKM